MAAVEDEIVAAGAQIIWMLEADVRQTPGTAELCMEAMDGFGSQSQGWCVGDGETQPVAGTFDNSPFSEARGFDIIVPRETMEIVWSSSHGSPSGNENLDGEDVLAAVQEAIGKL